VRNLTRWQRVGHKQPARRRALSAFTTGRVAANSTNAIGLFCPTGLAPGSWLPSGPRGPVRDQRISWSTQTD
jgi:catecholate siderophore receptor